MKHLASAAALCIALSALPALAQSGPPRSDREPGGAGGSDAPLTQLFISPCGEPFRATATAPYPVAAWFAKADANHDGAIDQAEFRADADAFFTTLDVNHDGVLSNAELSRYEHVVAPEILFGHQMTLLDSPAQIFLAQVGGMGGGIGDIGGMGGMGGMAPPVTDGGDAEPFQHKAPAAASMEGAAPFTLLAEPEPVTGSDMNLDGRVTRAEFQSAADRRFRRLDAGGKGKLTLASLPMTQQQKLLAGGRRGPPHQS